MKEEKKQGGETMGDLLKMQFDIIRERLVKRMEELSEEVAVIQPEGFNNNIHWNIGHLLTVTESFLFGDHGQLPAEYKELFSPGTKPADWKGEVPSIATLLEQSKDQLNRIKNIPNERFHDNLPEPKLGRKTLGEIAGFAIYHESYHFGQIHVMKRLIETSLIKK